MLLWVILIHIFIATNSRQLVNGLNTSFPNEIRVNTFQSKNNSFTTICGLKDGGFVVAWQSNDADGDSDGISAQMFHANGTMSGSEIIVNDEKIGAQQFPVLAGLTDGGFVITWQGPGQGGGSYDLSAKIFSSSGVSSGGQFQVTSFPSDIDVQIPPSIGSLSKGFVIAWDKKESGSPDYDIFAQIYDENGTKKGSEFRVNTHKGGDQVLPTVAVLSSESLIITWYGIGETGSQINVYASFYHMNGTGLTPEFRVNNNITNNYMAPSVCRLSDGNFIVTWCESTDFTSSNIYFKIYDKNGAVKFDDTSVYTAPGQFNIPKVACLVDGSFVIVWYDMDTFNLYAQAYYPDGSIRLPQFQVNSITNVTEQFPAITSLEGGGFAISWQGVLQNNSDAIFLQVYEANDTPFCDSVSQACQACQSNFECSSPKLCNINTGRCEYCLTNQDCFSNASYPICDLEKHECISDEEIVKPSVVGLALLGTSFGVLSPLFAFNPGMMFKLISIFRRFYYLQFCNVKLPVHLRSFLGIFSIGRFQYLPNFGKFGAMNDINVPSPNNFYRNKYTGFFLQTAGHIMFLWLLLFIVYLVLIIMEKRLSHWKIVQEKKPLLKYKKEFLPSMWDGVVSDLCYATFLQFLNPSGEEFFVIVSVMLALVTIFASIMVGWYRYQALRRAPPSIPINKKWIPLIEYGLQIVQPASIVFFYDFPSHQLAFLWIFNIMLTTIYLQSGKENRKKVVLEAFCIFVHMFMTFFVDPDLTDEKAHSLGTAVIIFIIFTVLMELGFVAIEGYKVIKELMGKSRGKQGTFSTRIQIKQKKVENKILSTKRSVKRNTPIHITNLEGSISGSTRMNI